MKGTQVIKSSHFTDEKTDRLGEVRSLDRVHLTKVVQVWSRDQQLIITWELVRNADFQSHLNLRNQNTRGWDRLFLIHAQLREPLIYGE